jgi:elongation factor P
MDVSELKKNVKLQLNGHPYTVTEFQFVKPGKGQGLYKCKVKNLITGAVIERTWRSGEKLEPADVRSSPHQFVFATASGYTFMDIESYEQIEVSAELIGDDKNFLLDQIQCDVLFYNGKCIGVTLPSHVVMELVECEAGVKGDTSSGATKIAKVQTGYELHVPLFIKVGEKVKIDTRTGEYVERVNG